MKRIPGFTALVILLSLFLSFGVIASWEPNILLGMGVVLVLLVGWLILGGIRGGAKIYRHSARRDSNFERTKVVQRLVKSLASKDKKVAKRAARLLGEMTAPGTALNRGVVPPEDVYSWRRWNEWWAEHHSSSQVNEPDA